MKRARWFTLAGVATVGVAAAGVALLSGGARTTEARADAQDPAEEAATLVSVKAAELGPVSVRLTSTSAVEAEQTAEVFSETSGILTEIRVREGDRVAAGAVLARVDATARRLAFEQAELRRARAEAELARQQRAFEQDLVAETDYEKARFDRDLAASELETARLELERTEIRAPFAGRVTELVAVAGSRVEPAEALLTLADFETLVARLHLPERDVAGIAPGQPALVRPESDASGKGIRGRIREVSPVVDPGTGTVKVTVEIPGAAIREAEASVRPGSFARVAIETGRRENAVLAPKRAVIRSEAGAFVFVVENGRAERREVTVGVEVAGPGGALLELPRGVLAGERVVVAGQASLTSGAAVEILDGAER